jgi:putative hydrolase of HD superfamily
LAWLGQAYYPQLDLNRVLRMALLHDIGEVYAGDITPSDQVREADKHQLERASLEKVLGKLPASHEFLELWLEFENGESPEARFVHQIDRLEMGLQARVYQAQGFAGMDEFIHSARHALVDQQLAEIL